MNSVIRLVVDKLVGEMTKIDNEYSCHSANNNFAPIVNSILISNTNNNAVELSTFVNDLYLKKPLVIPKDDFHALSCTPTAYFAISADLFEFDSNSKEIICYTDGSYNILSIVTKKYSQSYFYPVLINPIKLAELCTIMIENNEYSKLGIDFIGVEYKEAEISGSVICNSAFAVNLFKIVPDDLIIDFSYSPQLQIWMKNIDQSWDGSMKEWALSYLQHFVDCAQIYKNRLDEEFVESFHRFIA